MLSSQAIKMMLNANPIALCFEVRFSTKDKVNHVFSFISEQDKQALLNRNSEVIQAFNNLCCYLIGQSVKLNTIDRYRRQVINEALAAKNYEVIITVNNEQKIA